MISVRKRAARPEGVPPDYVIRTFTARVFYGDSEWRSVKLEVGRDEVGVSEADVMAAAARRVVQPA